MWTPGSLSMQYMAFALASLWKPKAQNGLQCPPTRTAVNHHRSDTGTAKVGHRVKKQLYTLRARLQLPPPPIPFTPALLILPDSSEFKSSLLLSLSIWGIHNADEIVWRRGYSITRAVIISVRIFFSYKSYSAISSFWQPTRLTDTLEINPAGPLHLQHILRCGSCRLMWVDWRDIMLCC